MDELGMEFKILCINLFPLISLFWTGGGNEEDVQ